MKLHEAIEQGFDKHFPDWKQQPDTTWIAMILGARIAAEVLGHDMLEEFE